MASSGLEKAVNLLGWEDRLSRFEEKPEHRAGLYIIAFLLGTLFGMILVEFIMPYLLNYGMRVFP